MSRLADLFLWPLARIYSGATYLRNCSYNFGLRSVYRTGVPVICVGNISVGGNGKTPTCMYLIEKFRQRGFAPVVLTRGYGGSISGPYLVKSSDSPDFVGDEPLLIVRKLNASVVIAKDRVAGAKFIESQALGSIIILDDGFQHRRLARNMDIVLVHVGTQDALDSFINGDLLPRGLWREGRDGALQRADCVILTYRQPILNGGLPEIQPELRSLIPPWVPLYQSFVRVEGVFNSNDNSEIKPCAAAAFTGIAQPEAFFATLEAQGFELRARDVFPDHHRFKTSDLQLLRQKYPNLPLLCTEKDLVKISPAWGDQVGVVRINTYIEPSQALIRQILPTSP